METSLMLHFRPELVRMDRAEDFPSAQAALSRENRFFAIHGPHGFGWQANDLNPAGVVGNAAAASAEKGAAIAAHQASGFVELLKEIHKADLSILK
jgi:creatinine amidohydrolase